ncbi:arylsulfatase [Aestuariicella hydrocarbonica]|uniref:Arylsulfatase n=1 Tax=Pseudomaricurvus hydrocarbonicus TaxID=1470433 RepID=A0A9E5JWQ1_9GAMM|nr:arylsulfatase [Aestuariicella hydrocarbonica]NHO65966.1 arylsulfatase [Aestuariicella hydrocarbonica]
MKQIKFRWVAAVVLCLGTGWLGLRLPLLHAEADAVDRSVLPIPAKAYEGKLEPTEDESTPMYPSPVKAPHGAPNILLVMTDDVGFASASTFGGPVPTPNLDRLASEGLRYNQFHTTGICSPTRASLLTSRNHHAVGLAAVVELNSPYPGYTGHIPTSAAPVARILRDNGYNTAMFGKDHNVPAAERSPSGPFDQWPTGRGFEYFYGFVGGDSDQWQPALYEGISPVDGSHRPDDYLLDEELADKTINWIHNQKASAPDKPFFAYLSTGSAHAPHQAPKEWIEKFKGKFDQGWDEERENILKRQLALGVVPEGTQLAKRPDIIPAWHSLSAEEQRVYARYMEVYAAMLAYQDAQFGRVMDELKRMGQADNTLVVFIEGDNGSSGEGGLQGTLNEMAHLSSSNSHPEDIAWLDKHLDIMGGPDTYQGFPIGWTYATNSPFPWFKTHASHLGGVRNGLVISWPQKMQNRGEVRSQYHHVVDIMPTLLDAAGIPQPKVVDGVEQQRVDGKSMLYSFDEADVASVRTTQYYEVLGNRGIYHDGWLASTTPRNMPWDIASVRGGSDVTSYPWELYNLNEDFSQSRNVAAQYPQKLEELKKIFDQEARNNYVYPIQDSGGNARAMRMIKAAGTFRDEYEFWGPGIQLQLVSSPPIYKMPFVLTAEIDVPEGGADGVIVAAGSYFSGWSFYLKDGKPVAYAAISPLNKPGLQSRIASDTALTPGKHQLRYEFDHDGAEGGELAIFVDGEKVAQGEVTRRPEILAGNGETFDTGRDANVPVSKEYQDQGVFTGTIEKITVKIKMPLVYRAYKAITG